MAGYELFDKCDWCGESFVIRHGCECKQLAGNQDWLDKAGLMVKPVGEQPKMDATKTTEYAKENGLKTEFPT